jgi:hypothetical protein
MVAIVGAAALIIAAVITTMLPTISGPNPVPAPATTTHSVIDVAPPPPPATPDGFAATKSEIVARFGGTLGEWTPRPPDGWAYRATISRALTFTVPAGCVVDDPIGRHKPGEHITATELTVYCPAVTLTAGVTRTSAAAGRRPA